MKNKKTTCCSVDVGKVVSILISSEFLQMETLVGLCLGFFKDNASAIIASPIDLNCINTKLVWKLFNVVTKIKKIFICCFR